MGAGRRRARARLRGCAPFGISSLASRLRGLRRRRCGFHRRGLAAHANPGRRHRGSCAGGRGGRRRGVL
ncbi:MAG: hypothetical protein FJW30_22800 [Acidobacteria bacterium]|nr:hypothetical protein [Acidobacteriota bacterium]